MEAGHLPEDLKVALGAGAAGRLSQEGRGFVEALVEHRAGRRPVLTAASEV